MRIPAGRQAPHHPRKQRRSGRSGSPCMSVCPPGRHVVGVGRAGGQFGWSVGLAPAAAAASRPSWRSLAPRRRRGGGGGAVATITRGHRRHLPTGSPARKQTAPPRGNRPASLVTPWRGKATPTTFPAVTSQQRPGQPVGSDPTEGQCAAPGSLPAARFSCFYRRTVILAASVPASALPSPSTPAR